jgi:hypothetical protein
MPPNDDRIVMSALGLARISCRRFRLAILASAWFRNEIPASHPLLLPDWLSAILVTIGFLVGGITGPLCLYRRAEPASKDGPDSDSSEIRACIQIPIVILNEMKNPVG